MGFEYNWEELNAQEEFPYLFGDSLWLEKKNCYTCGQNKILNEFYEETHNPDGKSSRCKSCVAANAAAYLKKYPERNRAAGYRRRALKLNAEGNTTAKQIRDRWEVYGNRCYLCGKPAEATDHLIPLAKGGSNWPSNLRPICRRCNSTKGPKWPHPATKKPLFPTSFPKIGHLAY